MPRFLFHVDEPSRGRSPLRYAVLFVTDDQYASWLAQAQALRAMRSEHRDICALSLYVTADWYAEPPFGDATASMVPSGTAGTIASGPMAPNVEPVRVDDERLQLDEGVLVLACITREGRAVTTEGYEFDVPLSPRSAITERVRTGDHVEWGLHAREGGEPQVSVGVWFDLEPGEELPSALREEASSQQRASIDAAIARLRSAIRGDV